MLAFFFLSLLATSFFSCQATSSQSAQASNTSLYPNATIALILPFTGIYSSPKWNLWESVIKLSANFTGPGNGGLYQTSLTIQSYDTQSSGVIAVQMAQQAAAAGAIAVIGAGVDFHTDLISVVLDPLGVPVISPTAYQSVDADVNNWFTVSPPLGAQGLAVQQLLNYFSWNSSIGIMYSNDDSSTAIAEQIMSNKSLGFTYTSSFVPGVTANDAMTNFVKFGANIMIYISNDTSLNASFALNNAANQFSLYSQGKTWIVCNVPSNFIAEIQYPPGTFVIDTPTTSDTYSILAFINTLASSYASAYPGLGPTSQFVNATVTSLDPALAYVWDTVVTLGFASSSSYCSSKIDSICVLQSLQSGLVMPTNVTIISGSNFTLTTVTGPFSFDANNQRVMQTNIIYNTKDAYNVSYQNNSAFLWDGVSGHSFSPLYLNNGNLGNQLWFPAWPGAVITIPDPTITYIPLAFVAPISALAQLGARAIFQLAIDTVNNEGYLPPGYRLTVVPFDDRGNPQLDSSLALTFPNFGIVGILGAAESQNSAAVQTVAQAYGLPQISPVSSSPYLSDKAVYPTFFRNIPPDSIQSEAILAFATQYGWTEVGIISSPDLTGTGIAFAFQNISLNINILAYYQLSGDAPTADYQSAFNAMSAAGVRIVLVLCGDSYTFYTMINAVQLGFKPAAWVVANAAILEFGSGLQPPGFDQNTFNGVISCVPAGGIGLKFLQYLTACNNADPNLYPGAANLAAQSPFPYVYDAVFIMGDAIKRMIEGGFSPIPANGPTLVDYLRTTDLVLTTGVTTFNANQDRIGPYVLMNVVGGQPITVATWNPVTGIAFLPNKAVIWPDGTTNIPKSAIQLTSTWLSWKSGAAIAFVILSSIGILNACIMAFLVVFYRNLPVIKGATPEFLMLMLFGTALGYGSVLTWIGEPKSWICAFRIWLPPMAFSLLLAPLLAKTWRLHRIFSAGTLRVAPVPLWKLSMVCFSIVAPQLIICIYWISLGTYQPAFISDQTSKFEQYVVCGQDNHTRVCAYLTYAYQGLCLLVGAYLAFKVRKLPKNFNESKWIGYSIYNVMLWSIIMLILGYTLSKFAVTVEILICVASLVICTGTIGFMLAPKLVQILIDPEMRSSKVNSSGGTGAGSKLSSAR